MRDSPTNQQMNDPQNHQSGKPNYLDKSVEDVGSKFYPNRGQDAPAYVASNPRYWEYR